MDQRPDLPTEPTVHETPNPAPDAPTWGAAPSAAPDAPAGPTATRRSAWPLAAVLGSALLSAILASTGTALLVGHPASQATASAAPAATASPTAQFISAASEMSAVEQVAAALKPAVVTITAAGSTGFSPFSVPTGVGSGIVVSSDGLILTNRHVVSGAQALTVTFSDGRELTAKVLVADANVDLAVVKVDATGLTAARLGDAASIKVGQVAIAIGSPLGTFTETVTKGIISATGRTITVSDGRTGRPTELHGLIQTDAAINEGNSGGPRLDLSGAVIGVNTAAATSAEGIGFATPIDAALTLIDQAKKTTG